jgi:hypothetical protein
MSISKIASCNIALSHIGSSERITALTDDTKEARILNLMYDFSRQFVLQDFEWGFAERRALLSLLSVEVTGFDYAYQYPNGCLKAREIYQSVPEEKPIDYLIMAQDTEDSTMIVTNEQNATLIYTADITNVNMFSAAFNVALSYQIAANIAVPLTEKPSLKNSMLTYYGAYIDRAKLLDAQQSNYSTLPNNDFLQSRGYSG